MSKYGVPIAAAILLFLAGAGNPAAAHAILIDSTPAVNGTVDGPNVSFTLRYNSRIDKGRSKVTLTAPDQSVQKLPIDDGGAPDILTGKAALADGHYELRWQVLAVDGHITRGIVPFDVKHP